METGKLEIEILPVVLWEIGENGYLSHEQTESMKKVGISFRISKISKNSEDFVKK